MLFGPHSHSALAAGSYTAIVREGAPSVRLLSNKMCSVPSTSMMQYCESLLRGVLTAGQDKPISLLEQPDIDTLEINKAASAKSCNQQAVS